MPFLQIQMTPAGTGGPSQSYSAYPAQYMLVCQISGNNQFCNQVVRREQYCEKLPSAYQETTCNPQLATNYKWNKNQNIIL